MFEEENLPSEQSDKKKKTNTRKNNNKQKKLPLYMYSNDVLNILLTSFHWKQHLNQMCVRYRRPGLFN